MARPTLDPLESKLERIAFRVTPDQYADIIGKADKCGMSLSGYARGIVLNGKVNIRTGRTNDGAVLSALGHIGNNINQMAKALNTIQAANPQGGISRALQQKHNFVLGEVMKCLEEIYARQSQ